MAVAGHAIVALAHIYVGCAEGEYHRAGGSYCFVSLLQRTVYCSQQLTLFTARVVAVVQNTMPLFAALEYFGRRVGELFPCYNPVQCCCNGYGVVERAEIPNL